MKAQIEAALMKHSIYNLAIAYHTVKEYVAHGWWDRLPAWIEVLRQAQEETGVTLIKQTLLEEYLKCDTRP